MKCWIIRYDGTKYALPTAVSWEFSYGLGSPCDSFEVCCLWEPDAGSNEAEKILAGAVRFQAEENGRRVFTGVVDEFSCVRDGNGCRLELSGRGMQALLLDNEALPAEYQLATVRDILRRHAEPYGITLAGEPSPSLGPVAGFSVESGQSEWSVIRGFACFHNGVVPRFDPMGRLILSDWGEGETRRRLGEKTAVTELRYTNKRYGVLSQVVVRDKARKSTETVSDAAFQNEGGCCRRVVCTPGASSTPAMRFSAEYQLRASRAERETCSADVAEGFAAWPGELVEVARSGFEGNGLYRVREASVKMDGRGISTKLTLGPVDLIV